MDEQLERRSTTGQCLITGLVLWFSWFWCVQVLGVIGPCLIAGLVSWFSWFQCLKAAAGTAESGEMRKVLDWGVQGKGGTKDLKWAGSREKAEIKQAWNRGFSRKRIRSGQCWILVPFAQFVLAATACYWAPGLGAIPGPWDLIPSRIKVLPCPWVGVHCGVMVDLHPDETLPTHRRLKFVTEVDHRPTARWNATKAQKA